MPETQQIAPKRALSGDLTAHQKRRRAQLRQQQEQAEQERYETAEKARRSLIAPTARPAYLRLRHWVILFSFLMLVVAPAGAAGYYLYTRAADQYASTVGFTVRREETGSAYEILGGLTNFSNASSSDTDILYEFIQSQELVRAIDDSLDLRRIFRKPDGDVLFALKDKATIEDLMIYWKRMVRVAYDPGTGLIEVEARAFDPRDATAIATEIFDRSNIMINQLSTVARSDTTRYAEDELNQAVSRLKVARQALTRFRNDKRLVDPTADIQSQMGLLNSLQTQLAGALIDLDLLEASTRSADPRIDQANRKIMVIENRIEGERQKLGVGGGQGGVGYAALLGEYESLQVDLEFAQNAYTASLSAYDTAVAEARRQSRYLAAYLKPTLPESAIYPKRAIILTVATLMLFGVWSILVLVFYSLRDRR
ncbi:MAG: hypothetical protein WBC93_22400 [Sulfitobacter sp.]